MGQKTPEMPLPRLLPPVTRRRRRALYVATISVAVLLVSGLVSPSPSATPILERRALDIVAGRVTPGSARVVDTGGPTQLVGLEWTGGPAATFEVRGQRNGRWEPWGELETEGEEGPDADSPEYRGRRTVGPIWMGHGVRTVEVRLVDGDVSRLRLHAIRSEERRPRGAITAANAVAIATRPQWGADESLRKCPQEYAAGVRYAVVHHTAHGGSANSYSPSDSASIIRGIYSFHTQVNGWCDIGYNFLVDRYGQIFEGRYGGMLSPVIGAHASGFNTESTGVAVIGEFGSSGLPSAGFNALADVLAWKLGHHGVNPNATVNVVAGEGSPRYPPGTTATISTVSGHRDVGSTSCPGDHLHAVLPRLRGDAAARVGGALFSPWESMGGVLTSSPAVTSGAPGRLDVAVRGSSNSLWHKSWNNGWTAWRPVSGNANSAPTLSSWGPRRIDLFVRGTANDLQHRWAIDGAWSGWESLGGVLTSEPAAIAWATGRIDVFARGIDNALWHTWFDGRWRGWESLGGDLRSAPAVASMTAGRLDVFVRGTDDGLWQKTWGNGWSPWIGLGGVLRSAPGATSWGSGRVDVFVRGTDDAVWHRWWDGHWKPWVTRGGAVTSAPAAESWEVGRLDVFARGTDNAAWHIWSN